MLEKLSIFSNKNKSFNLLFQHPEDGKHFTEVENFGYSIKKLFSEIKEDKGIFSGFFMYDGEVHCNNCDSGEDDCECEDRPFDFDEAAVMFEHQIDRYEIIKDIISELNSGKHDCLTFTYETFKSVIDAIGDTEEIRRLDKDNETICQAIIRAAQEFNAYLDSYGKKSISRIYI